MIYLQERGGDVWLQVHVQPGAKHTAWAGEYGERIKIRLNAPPVEGRANTALTVWLAQQFGCVARNVVVLKGELSRTKTVCFSGMAGQYEEMRDRIALALRG
ncbi:hypothetical protein DTO96_100854 [Ephemeroptericola cinctiostellae]|uniref:UPF0235 protein DTO96_100854 n=1 Tax=Ephemeroptericola cinctiostellae TaxID=2268024 RepID=A0A345D9U6_9BURK|nr:DUF167 domain-containing protein [Ephemeroptericola cinctiostellae]AXF85134.1 hypothetical protein DTO96_100854 [Ephemeroptericola cinctiostellae]